jgi:hypothetical protein
VKTFITLDYELFFGEKSGTVEKTIIEPTKALLKILDKWGVKATFFVDVGYLARAEKLGCDLVSANKVKEQIKWLYANGHDIQLHIHPHWHTSKWEAGKWQFDLSKYKLSDFCQKDASSIIKDYSRVLAQITGEQPVAYRAGGWCIQPFSHIADALFESGVRVDSTVYVGGRNDSHVQGFNFSKCPELPFWRFSHDPLKVKADGRFVELPIASTVVSPLFYWQLALSKKLGAAQHESFGDGHPMAISKDQLKRLLTQRSRSVASIDGYKSKLMGRIRETTARDIGSEAPLVFIGHPKAFSRYSLSNLNQYISKHFDVDNFATVKSWHEEL